MKREDSRRSPAIISGFGGEKMLRDNLSPEQAAGQGPPAQTVRNPLSLDSAHQEPDLEEAPEKRPACPAS